MIPIKTSSEIAHMRTACRLSAEVLAQMASRVAPGVTTGELDAFAAKRMQEMGIKSAFLGYHGYPGCTCISLNEEVVHGIPSPNRMINAGDLVSIDVGIEADGFIGDNALTVQVGTVDSTARHLCEVCEKALQAGIAAATVGAHVSDIGYAVQSVTEGAGFSVVRDYCGHGVGRALHEEPQIPNYGKRGHGPLLRAGMTLAIEPMINAGASKVEVLENQWTVRTVDRRPSAHFEHTILVTENGPEILTCAEKK